MQELGIFLKVNIITLGCLLITAHHNIPVKRCYPQLKTPTCKNISHVYSFWFACITWIMDQWFDNVKSVTEIVDRWLDILKTVTGIIDRWLDKLKSVTGIMDRWLDNLKCVTEIVDRWLDILKTLTDIVDQWLDILKTVTEIVDRWLDNLKSATEIRDRRVPKCISRRRDTGLRRSMTSRCACLIVWP